VVWPNGALASTAIGFAMGLLTGWSGSAPPQWRVDYKGSQLLISESNLAVAMRGSSCKHYSLAGTGDGIKQRL